MLKPSRLVIDTNVWLYYFLGRQPECEASRNLFLICQAQEIALLYTPTTLKDFFYLLPRQMRRDALAAHQDAEVSYLPAAWSCVEVMSQIATAVSQGQAECTLARGLRGSHNDLEDNLLVAAAETAKADYIVTYDRGLIHDYAPVCLTPEQALALVRRRTVS